MLLRRLLILLRKQCKYMIVNTFLIWMESWFVNFKRKQQFIRHIDFVRKKVFGRFRGYHTFSKVCQNVYILWRIFWIFLNFINQLKTFFFHFSLLKEVWHNIKCRNNTTSMIILLIIFLFITKSKKRVIRELFVFILWILLQLLNFLANFFK